MKSRYPRQLSTSAPHLLQPIRKRVLQCLEEYPVIRGPLNISPLVSSNENRLSDEELCEFITHYPQCEILILSHWNILSDKFLRSVSMTMGMSLLDLDLSHSSIQYQQTEVLFSRLFVLSHLRLSHCPNIDSLSLRIITQTCHKTLQLLYIDHNPSIKHDAMLYISGDIGVASPKLNQLRAIDLAYCPLIQDRSLIALASACRKLRHVNLQRNDQISDVGLIAIIRNCSKLELLNVLGCCKLTSLVLQKLSQCCPNLQSINAAHCSLFTDDGVVALARGCRKIQAISLAGIRNMSEIAICALAENCSGLLMLNVTGYICMHFVCIKSLNLVQM